MYGKYGKISIAIRISQIHSFAGKAYESTGT
jgi:hypothetical protein